MIVSSRSLIGRVFLWNYEQLVEKTYLAEWYRERGTNLCHLIRTVFVVVPLKVLGMIFAATALAFVLEFPFLYNGLLGGLWVYAIIAAAMILFGGMVLLIASIRHREPESFGIVAAWVAAKKERVCPLVRFDA